jgi:hypothetical protein
LIMKNNQGVFHFGHPIDLRAKHAYKRMPATHVSFSISTQPERGR